MKTYWFNASGACSLAARTTGNHVKVVDGAATVKALDIETPSQDTGRM